MPATKEDYERLSAWAALLNPDQNIDRRGHKRVVPLEVINVSAPRTGTLSLNEAFSILGYANPYHMSSVFANCKDADIWQEALAAKYRPSPKRKPFETKDFDQVLGHCGAAGDAPCALLWRELMEAYPNAKLILVDRDEDKWLGSMKQLAEGAINRITSTIKVTDPFRTGRILNLGINWMGYWTHSMDNLSAKTVVANARETYRKHNADIRATVPKERLLEYRMGDGWEPLCKFLGKDVPDVPFPHRNDVKTMEASIGSMYEEALKASLRNIAVVVGGGAIVVGSLWQLYVSLNK
jgi:hypothetical protein